MPRFALRRSCLLTLHVAGGLRHESDFSWQYRLRYSLVVVMLTLCIRRGLQHAELAPHLEYLGYWEILKVDLPGIGLK